jgi:hypothetical protein
MKRIEPPKWMERLLKSLLHERHREAVAGDLYEEFCEVKIPQMGVIRARLWYLGQTPSFIPQRLALPLNLLCFFTLSSGTWLGIMDLRLRHPGYAGRELIAGLIVGQAALTLAALLSRGLGWLRLLALAGCAAIVWLALHALVNCVARSALRRLRPADSPWAPRTGGAHGADPAWTRSPDHAPGLRHNYYLHSNRSDAGRLARSLRITHCGDVCWR